MIKIYGEYRQIKLIKYLYIEFYFYKLINFIVFIKLVYIKFIIFKIVINFKH
uniref:Uncharacterized protein n=1 Tax=Thuretia quercifolia TaxID=189650 RepID=A0A1Z1MKH9_9FLOR|nr:hypothetical protein [Thuretia quercifolia]ARW66446.1 hypothetical protein [Thuretia quercifolia]